MKGKMSFFIIGVLWVLQADTYVSSSFDARYSLMANHVTLEAGTQAAFDPYAYLLKNRHALTLEEQKQFKVTQAVDVALPGDYEVQYGGDFTLQVSVLDTTAPILKLNELSLKQHDAFVWGEEQYASVIQEVQDNTTKEETLKEHVTCETIDTTKAGKYEVPCEVVDEYDNKTTSMLAVSVIAPAISTPASSSSVASHYVATPIQLPSASYSGEEMVQLQQVATLVNQIRAEHGLASLSLDLGSYHSVTYARTTEVLTLYSHNRPNGQPCYTIYSDYGLAYRSSGENIAQGQQSAEEVVNDWMNSPAHRENILRAEFTTISVGVLGQGAQKVWVQEFFS